MKNGLGLGNIEQLYGKPGSVLNEVLAASEGDSEAGRTLQGV